MNEVQRLQLHQVTFGLLQNLEDPGCLIKNIFFVEEGRAARITTFEDGSQIAVGLFGYDSVIGIPALLGSKRSFKRVYMQIAGYGYSSPVEAARKEFNRGGTLQKLVYRCVRSQLVQATQSAGCIARHTVEQRLARWLLLCSDRVHCDTYVMAQESLADMLGSTRPSISLAAGLLKERKLIAYSRGIIRVLDPKGLEQRACECYRVIKNHFDNDAEFDSGITT